MIRCLDAGLDGFEREFDALLAFAEQRDPEVGTAVSSILNAVRERGDQAVIELTNRFDHRSLISAAEFEVSLEACHEALARIDPALRAALEQAALRIEQYHQRQRPQSWEYRDGAGAALGQRVTPMDRVGIYVPGGKASYPSSVLMNAIPARVAGVAEIVMVVPAPHGHILDVVLAAAAIAGVSRVFSIGGAQAIGALAYGTASVPAVDKIVGPGNVYVAEAKRQVFGTVGIDMVAGPSEIAIVCDGDTSVDWICYDLFSQAEHDENAQAILISPDAAFLEQVKNRIGELLPSMERSDMIGESLRRRGALIKVADLGEAARLINRIAPEHLELSVAEPRALMAQIRHAGAIFLGRYTSESLGDYCAGPSHVLPTSGTARFSSPLGVYDFQKRSSVIDCSEEAARALGDIATVLAQAESLQAHGLAAAARRGSTP